MSSNPAPRSVIHDQPAYRCARMVVAELGGAPRPAGMKLRRAALEVPRQLVNAALEEGAGVTTSLDDVVGRLRSEIEQATAGGELDAECGARLMALVDELVAGSDA
ncbi:MAG: hypothetical protein DWQ36_12280 [Acidobacteria bacterium]|nr:MAG: hypothetical protein DWQ30_13355 [Acidobacteriota bacterium]REK07317.1 MAG: hypothetical protein DWQ36_12280 [Acidobacteriota bacterium]